MYSGNRRLIALRTFSAVNPRVILFLQKMVKSAQNFLGSLAVLLQKRSKVVTRGFTKENHFSNFPKARLPEVQFLHSRTDLFLHSNLFLHPISDFLSPY